MNKWCFSLFIFEVDLYQSLKTVNVCWNCRWEKMSKAIEENKKKVTVKILASEHNLYWKFMCTDKNYDKNKTYKTYPLPPSTPVTVFLIAKKLLRLWLWVFHAFSLFLSTVGERLSISEWFDCSLLLIYWWLVKKYFLNIFMDFNPLQTKTK